MALLLSGMFARMGSGSVWKAPEAREYLLSRRASWARAPPRWMFGLGIAVVCAAYFAGRSSRPSDRSASKLSSNLGSDLHTRGPNLAAYFVVLEDTQNLISVTRKTYSRAVESQ